MISVMSIRAAILFSLVAIVVVANQTFFANSRNKIDTVPSPSPIATSRVIPSASVTMKPIYVAPKASIAPTPQPSIVPMVSCGLDKNTRYITMTKTECDKVQAEENNRIRNSYNSNYTVPSFAPWPSLIPFPSIEPYKPSQEYQDSIAKSMQALKEASEAKPSPFVFPSPKCNPVGDGFNCF